MKEQLVVTNKWHRTILELPEAGREVLGAEIIDKDDDSGERFGLMADMYYLKKGMIMKVEHDRSFVVESPLMVKKSAEEKLLAAIFGEDDDLQEIEVDGWYTFDAISGLFRYRKINADYEPEYWCYPIMPDGIEMNRLADEYKGGR